MFSPALLTALCAPALFVQSAAPPATNAVRSPLQPTVVTQSASSPAVQPAANLTGPFPGTGGPGSNFDWVIPPGVTVILDTTFAQIVGGPGGVPTAVQTVINGVVDVRNLTVSAGSELVVIGPNRMTIRATGMVTIDGEVSADGGNNFGVSALNTTNVPIAGAPGQAGGGDGGVGSFLVTMSTPRGGAGSGAFQAPNTGGGGGETSYHPTSKDARRGAGGGGGRFGPDVFVELSGTVVRTQGLTGLDAEPGFSGGALGTGAVSGLSPARGGGIASGPFTDGILRNNFFGMGALADGTPVQGELPEVWAGSGGGAGGDSVRSATFPLAPFNPTGDEQGAGGGGGAGGIHILALGPVLIGEDGSIHADGGHGNGGENTSFFDRVGGGSGGGSGGHIVIESADRVEIAAVAANAGFNYFDPSDGHSPRPISARGGQGGVGGNNLGGAGESGEGLWRCDSIPPRSFGGNVLPPLGDLCHSAQEAIDPQTGIPFTEGAGGDGGPGLLQIHVPDPATDLILPAAASGDVTQVFSPPPVGWLGGEFQLTLQPSFATGPAGLSLLEPFVATRVNPSGLQVDTVAWTAPLQSALRYLRLPQGE